MQALQAALMLDAGESDVRQIIVQDLETQQTVREIYAPGPTCEVRLFSWSPHARYLLLALAAGSALLYNLTSGEGFCTDNASGCNFAFWL